MQECGHAPRTNHQVLLNLRLNNPGRGMQSLAIFGNYRFPSVEKSRNRRLHKALEEHQLRYLRRYLLRCVKSAKTCPLIHAERKTQPCEICASNTGI